MLYISTMICYTSLELFLKEINETRHRVRDRKEGVLLFLVPLIYKEV